MRKKEIVLAAAGDVDWSTDLDSDYKATGTVFLDPGEKRQVDGGWHAIPRLISSETLGRLEENEPKVLQRYNRHQELTFGYQVDKSDAYILSNSCDLTFSSEAEWAKYPLNKVREVFREADIAFLNLETPLSDNAPRAGGQLTPTAFTLGLTDAGIDIVSVANNHMMDAQSWGLFDTLKSLDNAGIAHVGAGKNLAQARAPHIVEKNGIKLAFLAYAVFVNVGDSGFATNGRPGVAPLDPLVIKADIARLKDSVDHIILSFHWDTYAYETAKQFDLHPDAIDFAHEMIDAGADAILGHHSHIPRAVEYYKGKPILYSLSHLAMSFTMPTWVDNYVARLRITKTDIPSVEILPVAGKPEDMAQPYFLEGVRAEKMLIHLKGLSKDLGGNMRIKDGIGVLSAS